jgi:hypothetical protein
MSGQQGEPRLKYHMRISNSQCWEYSLALRWLPQLAWDPSLRSIIQGPLFHFSLICIILHKSVELMILCCKACLTLSEYPSSVHTSELKCGNSGIFIPNTFLKFFQNVRIVNTIYLSACTTNRSHKNLNRGGHNP